VDDVSPPRAALAGWFRRAPSGWALLGAAALCALFYLHVARTALGGRTDEAYLRTFVTGEFAVYPQSTAFRPGDGLAYAPGAEVELAGRRDRRHLARFDWWRFSQPKPWLKRVDGRAFFSIPPALRRPDLAHRLRLDLSCAYPPGAGARLAIGVNGETVAEAWCGQGPVALDVTLPPGRIGVRAYEEIRIARPGLSFAERMRIRLGLRFDAVALDRFSVTPQP
jgi:hypothetical protein